MTNIFHRNPHKQPPIAFGGKGMYLIDSDGKKYIDASGGAAVKGIDFDDELTSIESSNQIHLNKN